MATTDIFEKLKKLQNILVQKYDLESKVDKAPKQLTTQEELLARMKKEYIEKNAEYDEVKSNVLKLRFDLEEALKSIENGEKGMDNISTHREYEALEKQILEAKKSEEEIRKELQKQEKNLEEINENLKINEDMINSQESDLAQSKESLNKELEKYNQELIELKNEEDQITPDLDKEILFKFQRIIQRNSEGIVAVRNGVCTGCHMILPANFANEVREGENIQFCPYCSRILFYEEVSEDQAEDYFDISATGSLSDFEDEFDEDEDEFDEESDENRYDDGDMDASDADEDDEDRVDDENEDDPDEE